MDQPAHLGWKKPLDNPRLLPGGKAIPRGRIRTGKVEKSKSLISSKAGLWNSQQPLDIKGINQLHTHVVLVKVIDAVSPAVLVRGFEQHFLGDSKSQRYFKTVHVARITIRGIVVVVVLKGDLIRNQLVPTDRQIEARTQILHRLNVIPGRAQRFIDVRDLI